MILPENIIIGNLYRHDNGWSIVKVVEIYKAQGVPFITLSEFDENHDILLDTFCKKFNEIIVPELDENTK
jgi:hypothetical protein